MLKRTLWHAIIIIASISLVFILIGFFNAIHVASGGTKQVNQSIGNDISSSSINKKEEKNRNSIRVLIVGDSIAKGTGDEKAKGIGGYLPELLKNQTPKDIVVDNAGIDGYKVAELLEQMKSGKLDNAIEAADYVVISIGGNDLREIQTLKDVAKEQTFKDKQTAYLAALKEVTDRIRLTNKNAVMIFVGLYNPYGVEGPSDDTRLESTWNYNTQLIIDGDTKAVFIPTYAMFKFNLDHFIAGDKLHPNSTGYQAIAYLISKAIENTLSKT